MHSAPASDAGGQGTCAGLILLSGACDGTKANGQPFIGGLDVAVARNYYGAQADSFVHPIDVLEDALRVGADTDGPFVGVFIRAPMILHVLPGCSVRVLATLSRTARADKAWSHDPIVAVRQAHVLGTAFHPELTADTRWHRYFVHMVLQAGAEDNKAQALD